ncbi:hypothetical protein D3C84_1068660 [compost metagenome]
MAPLLWQPIEYFALQIVFYQRVAGGAFKPQPAPLCMELQSNAGVPAIELVQQALHGWQGKLMSVVLQYVLQFGGRQSQIGSAQLQQLTFQQQTHQLANRPPATGNPPVHLM